MPTPTPCRKRNRTSRSQNSAAPNGSIWLRAKMGFEAAPAVLPWVLKIIGKSWSARRSSNRRPSAWEAENGAGSNAHLRSWGGRSRHQAAPGTSLTARNLTRRHRVRVHRAPNSPRQPRGGLDAIVSRRGGARRKWHHVCTHLAGKHPPGRMRRGGGRSTRPPRTVFLTRGVRWKRTAKAERDRCL